LKIQRLNIAERLYRVTGEGIYRDSVLTGFPTPTQHPVLNGGVTGQDTVRVTPYRVAHASFQGSLNKEGTELAGQFTHEENSLPLTLRKK
jgi:hypothetical protein